MNSTDDIIELADTELAAAAHRVYDAGRVAGWTATDYEAAIDRTKVGSPTWDVLYEARRKLRQLPDVEHEPADGWVLFFDGSKSDDSTALVGCRLSDGHVVTLGIWAKPQGAPQAPPAPRGDVVNDALNQARAEWAEANDRVGRHEDEVAMAAQAANIIIGCRADSDLIAEATANERRTVRNWLQAKRDRDAAQAAISAAVAQYAEYGEVDA